MLDSFQKLEDQRLALLSDFKSRNRDGNSSRNALKHAWQYYIQENHLPSWKQEVAKDLFLLFVSAGSALYGIIANEYAKDKSEWERQLFIYGTALPAAAVLINATNEYFLRRSARRFPEELKKHYLPISRLKLFVEDMSVVLVSAVASISLSTAAWRYSSTWETKPFQIAWTIYIELVNTALHLLPVELVVFNHPVFSLPIKPLQIGGQWLYRLSLSPQEKIRQDFLAFKCKIVTQLTERFRQNLDRIVHQFLQDNFQWNGLSGGLKKWFSFVRKATPNLNDLNELKIEDLISCTATSSPAVSTQTNSSTWIKWLGRQFNKLAYGIGASWLISSCAGFLADPFATLGQSDINEHFSLLISSLASYFFGVLLGHMGGTSLQTDLIKILHTLRGQGGMPLHAKLHTKSFALWFFTSVVLARYSYAMSVELIQDHFSDTPVGNILTGISISGVVYMSFFAMQKFYEDYMTKFVSLNPTDENHLVAVFQRKFEQLKRHIPSDPDQLAEAFKHLPEEDIQWMFNMSKDELINITHFEEQYAVEKARIQKPYLAQVKDYARWMLCASSTAPLSADQKTLTNTGHNIQLTT